MSLAALAVITALAVLNVAGLQPPSGTITLASGGEGLELPVPPGEYSYHVVLISDEYAAALLYLNAHDARLERSLAGVRGSALLPAACDLVKVGVEPGDVSGLAAHELEPRGDGYCMVTLRLASAAAAAGPAAVYASWRGGALILAAYPLPGGPGEAASPEAGVSEAPATVAAGASEAGGEGGGVGAWGESRWLALAISLAVLAVSLVAELGVQRR